MTASTAYTRTKRGGSLYRNVPGVYTFDRPPIPSAQKPRRLQLHVSSGATTVVVGVATAVVVVVVVARVCSCLDYGIVFMLPSRLIFVAADLAVQLYSHYPEPEEPTRRLIARAGPDAGFNGIII